VEARRVLGVLNRPTATFARTPGQVRYTQSAPSTAPQKGGRRTIKYWYARKRPSVRGHSTTMTPTCTRVDPAEYILFYASQPYVCAYLPSHLFTRKSMYVSWSPLLKAFNGYSYMSDKKRTQSTAYLH
jgi:hypothetical protein